MKRALIAAAALLAAASTLTVATPAQAADESITVNFSVAGGSPTYRASGWIYGMTEDASGPADHFYRDVKFRYMRAGGEGGRAASNSSPVNHGNAPSRVGEAGSRTGSIRGKATRRKSR